jgi:hypothetical protein
MWYTWVALVIVVTAVIPSGGLLQSRQVQASASVLNSSVDENTVVRFFYDPPGDYFHFPLVLCAVKPGSSLLDTAPMLEEGRTAYIPLSDMGKLVRSLTQSGLGWTQMATIVPLGSFKMLGRAGIGGSTMQILIEGSKGTATVLVAPDNICQTLAPLDSAFSTPRALWEFHLLRWGYDCKVPGFKRDADPDHI